MIHPQLVVERPQFYPGADRSQWVPPTFAWAEVQKPISRIEMRATETATWPVYEAGQAPHLTVNFRQTRPSVRQHMPLGFPSREGQYSTMVEVRVVGTLMADGPGQYLPMAPEWMRTPVKDLWSWLHENWGARIPPGWSFYKPVGCDDYSKLRELMDL